MTKTAMLSAKVRPDQKRKLDRLAELTGRSRNAIVGEAIDLLADEPVVETVTTYRLAAAVAAGNDA